jgi:hypothetical protein
MMPTPKYKSLIENLFENGHFNQAAYDALVKADNRAIKYLTRELLANPNPHIRETCAEILRERGHARAVPSLIEALKDGELFVRQDALWAIGSLCGFERFEMFLRVTNVDPPWKLYRRVSEWWRLNKRYIENNWEIW